MSLPIIQGFQVSLGLDVNGNPTTNPASMVWYKLTDHGRQPMSITYTLVEQADRMANGTMRKYVVARKFVIKADWKEVPSLDNFLVDYDWSTYGPAWIKAFYEANNFSPVWVRMVFAQDVGTAKNTVPTSRSYQDSRTIGSSGQAEVYQAFMTTFTYDVLKRTTGNAWTNGVGYDLVDLSIEFTEI